ncbi:inositol monophosphatase [Solibacillus sp. MA9]|uniref:Inositol monophosphatase n=1 Tax=Solibacillus palustris TaxID=2908203 RepID=A0ABS9UB10_9BACL|nr:inositol monophosphatase [Solibacillus sp. MA9]MCH7321541.1 inositol monophosphatase [Solibacillus sp. MA9]
MESIIEKATIIAKQAVIEAGNLAKGKFGQTYEVDYKGVNGDVVTEIDIMAEEIIVNTIRKHFPSHRIQSEEMGDDRKDSDWIWQIDPLDGTNNFAIGLPVFSSSIVLLHKNIPVLAAIYEPILSRLFFSTINGGTYCNDISIVMEDNQQSNKLSIGWIQGHGVQNDSNAVRLRQFIDLNSKRMIRLWAPTIQWCMLAKGDLDGIILFNSPGEDLLSGVLMVKEAGGIVIDFDGNDFTGSEKFPFLIACHPNKKEVLIDLVNNGLGESML